MLHKMIASAHLVGLTLVDSARRRLDDNRERGSYTVELVVVLAAIVLIAVAVTAVIKTGVLKQANAIFGT